MAIGTGGGTNPKLEIDVVISDEKTKREFKKFQDKIEREAKSHEKNLKRITEKGDSQRKVVKGKFHDKLEAAEKAHKQKLRQIQELSNQRTLLKQKAYQQKSLASQKSWSAKMSTGLSSLVMGMKVFAAAYAIMFIRSAISGALGFVDSLRKQSENLEITIEKLQVYNQMLIDAGSNTERNVKILNTLITAMKDLSDPLIQTGLANLNIDVASDNVGDALDKIIKQVKEKTISTSALVDVFGKNLAAKLNSIALAAESFEVTREKLGKAIITESQAREVEKFNDAISRLTTTVKIGFAKAMAGPAGDFANTIDEWKTALADIDWIAIGNVIFAVIKVVEFLGKAFTSHTKTIASVTLSTRILIGSWSKLIGIITALSPLIKEFVGFKTILAEVTIINGLTIRSIQESTRAQILATKSVMSSAAAEKTAGELRALANKETFRLSKEIEVATDNYKKLGKEITNTMKAEMEAKNLTSKFSKGFIKLGTEIATTWNTIKAGGGFIGGLVKMLGTIGTALIPILKLLGKISIILTAVFIVVDFFDAMSEGLGIAEAAGYALLKVFTDIADSIIYLASFGQFDAGISNGLKRMVFLTKETIDEFEDLSAVSIELSSNFRYLSERLLDLKSKLSLTRGEHVILENTINQLNTSYSEFLGKINLEKDSFNDVKKAIEGATTALEEHLKQAMSIAILDSWIKKVSDAAIALRENEQAIKDNQAAMLEFMRTGIMKDGDKFIPLEPGDTRRYIREIFMTAETELRKEGKKLLGIYEKIYQDALDIGTDFNKKKVPEFVSDFKIAINDLEKQVKIRKKAIQEAETHLKVLFKLRAAFAGNSLTMALNNIAIEKTRKELLKLQAGVDDFTFDIKLNIKPLEDIDPKNIISTLAKLKDFYKHAKLEVPVNLLLDLKMELKEQGLGKFPELRKLIENLEKFVQKSMKPIVLEGNIFFDLQEFEKRAIDIPVELSGLQRLKSMTDENSVSFALLQQRIKELEDELSGMQPPPTDFFGKIKKEWKEFSEQYLKSLTDIVEFINITFGEVANLVNALNDAQLVGLQNQMDILREVIRLENERWTNSSERMRESGIEQTAYYIKLKKEHAKTIKALEKKEQTLKGKTWDADQQAKITQTIMATAQSIMTAFAANTILGIIMTPILTALGAIQVASISSQQNPYRLAAGGEVPGDKSREYDHVQALLVPGEFVVNKEAAQKNASLLQTINNSSTSINNYSTTLPTQNLATGGLVKETASNLSSVINNTTHESTINNNIYINVDGNLIDNTDWVENSLIPTINEAVRKGHQLETN